MTYNNALSFSLVVEPVKVNTAPYFSSLIKAQTIKANEISYYLIPPPFDQENDQVTLEINT